MSERAPNTHTHPPTHPPTHTHTHTHTHANAHTHTQMHTHSLTHSTRTCAPLHALTLTLTLTLTHTHTHTHFLHLFVHARLLLADCPHHTHCQHAAHTHSAFCVASSSSPLSSSPHPRTPPSRPTYFTYPPTHTRTHTRHLVSSCLFVFSLAFLRPFVRACVRACVRAFVRSCVRAFGCSDPPVVSHARTVRKTDRHPRLDNNSHTLTPTHTHTPPHPTHTHARTMCTCAQRNEARCTTRTLIGLGIYENSSISDISLGLARPAQLARARMT